MQYLYPLSIVSQGEWGIGLGLPNLPEKWTNPSHAIPIITRLCANWCGEGKEPPLSGPSMASVLLVLTSDTEC